MSGDPCPNCPIFSVGLGGRGVHLVIPSMIAPIVAAFLVVNRVYWRFKMVGSLGLDDISTILALTFLFAQCGASIAAVNLGYGRTLDTMNWHQASQALKCFFLLQVFYKLTINCTKLSILFLYLRIFTDRLWFVRTCWTLIAIVVCACVSFTTATLLQCHPIERAWERWNGNYRCVNIYALWYTNAIYSILTDFIIVLMVPPVIFKLKLPMRQKLALTCIFGLGVIVCAASISRLTTLYSSAYGEDPTAGSLISSVWTTIEAGLGVICANLPMLRTPLQRLFPKLFPSRSGTNQLSNTTPTGPNSSFNSGKLASPDLLGQASPHLCNAHRSGGPVVNGLATARTNVGVCSPSRGISPPIRNMQSGDCEGFKVRRQPTFFTDEDFCTDQEAGVEWYNAQHKAW